MYSEYSKVLTKSIPRTPNVVTTNPNEIIAPIIYPVIRDLLYCLGVVNLSLGITSIVINGR